MGSSSTAQETLASHMRHALRRLAKAVVIITSAQDGRRYAMAATAVSEISTDPPSMLVCINRSASIHVPLSAGAPFAINILHTSHRTLASRCSGQIKGEARFAEGVWEHSAAGIPYLSDAQACFFCRKDGQLSYGTHDIFIGLVEIVLTLGPVNPLVYVDGRYTYVPSVVG